MRYDHGMTVREALRQFYRDNGFSDDDAQRNFYRVNFGPFVTYVHNPEARKRVEARGAAQVA